VLRTSATLVLAIALAATGAAVTALPERLSDRQFWTLTESMSEPDGTFGMAENLVSNESILPMMVGVLKRWSVSGVFIGVGPEQNFSYLAAAHPQMAFIVDIRKVIRNLHLLYKGLFEVSKDRAEFLGRLFSRRRPTGTSVRELFDTLKMAPADSQLLLDTTTTIRKQLVSRHHFPLTDDDLRSIEHILAVFYSEGPAINWWDDVLHTPSFESLMTVNQNGGQSFLAADESFQFVKALHSKNMIVPVVGDFSGGKALPAVASYIRDHNASLSVFYGSNVDDFLKDERLSAFCTNLSKMPITGRTIYIGGDGSHLAGYRAFSVASDMCEQLTK
jgi:hypothetical protein